MNNIFQAQLQLNLNTKWKNYKDGTHGEPHVISVEEKNNTFVVTNLVDGEEESICVDLLPSGYWAVIVLKKKKEFTSPQRPRGGIHVRGHLANGTAWAGLKQSPADINTGFGGGVASSARPNPRPSITGHHTHQSNIMMDTTIMNIEQFHSPTNNNDDGLNAWNKDNVAMPHLDNFLEDFGLVIITSFQDRRTQQQWKKENKGWGCWLLVLFVSSLLWTENNTQ